MSKNRDNIAVLVKAIIEKDPGMMHVKDSALIPYYVNNVDHMVEIESINKDKLTYFEANELGVEDDFKIVQEKQLKFAKDLGANYVFTSNIYIEEKLLGISTPFMIISDKESDFLVKNFYKDVSKEVSEAAKGLEIKLFYGPYECYSEGIYAEITHIKKEYGEKRKELENKYGTYLKRMPNDEAKEFSKYRREMDAKVSKLSGKVKDNKYLNDSDFLNFIFSLPYEEQNIDENKEILRRYDPRYGARFDYIINLLAKEYSEGKYFQEYFDCISDRLRKKVIPNINYLKRNSDHDTYLFKKGFIVDNLDPIRLYKEDSESFMKYFEKISDDSKRFVIEKIYDEQFVNHDVVDWLDENYASLLRDVGFLGGNNESKSNKA